MASRGNGNNGKGRKKIKMEKMKNESNLQVTFSKRRKGAIRKAHELTILTGAEISFIVFSPGGKVYSFGHPSVQSVTDRFLNGISQPLTPIQQQIQNERNQTVAETNASLTNVKNQLEFERNHGKVLDRQLNASQGRQLGPFDVDKQNLLQLQQSLAALQNFSEEAEREIDAQVLRGRQNYGVPTGGYYYSREGGLAPLPLMGAIYDGSGSGLPALAGPIPYAGSRGCFFPFPMGHSGYRVGGSVGVVRSQAGLGSNESCDGWTSSAGPSSFGGGGSGPFIAGPSSLIGGACGGWPLSARHSYFGGSGGETFTAGPSPLLGGCGGLPTTNGASSFGVGHRGSTSNAGVPEWDDLMPPNRFSGAI